MGEQEGSMFKGTVNLRAGIKGCGLRFATSDFKPNGSAVDKVVIEGPTGDYILSTVHLSCVATRDDGRELAAKVNAGALDRLAYHYGTAIEDARITGDQFSPLTPQPGAAVTATAGVCLYLSASSIVTFTIPPDQMKAQLEHPTSPGERFYGLYRSALLSPSQVEAYMHLYNLLLMLHNDSQGDVDSFIIGEDPAVPQTQHPKKKSGVKETIYTRLRDEFAHYRPGVSIVTTKEEMAGRLGRLRELTKKAIELQP
jgi:hypothetical protein